MIDDPIIAKSRQEKGQPRIRPAPEYSIAVESFIGKVANALLVAKYPFLGRMGAEQVDAIPERPASPDASHGASTGEFEAESRMILQNTELLELNAEALGIQLWEMADQTGGAVMKRFYDFMSTTCEEAGTVFDSGGRPISHDSVMDMIEKIHFEVDEMGRPKGFEIHCSPANAQKLASLPPMNAKQRARFDDLMRSKAEAQRASRRHRRLARPAP